MRVTAYLLIAFLVLTPFLGSATQGLTRQVWTKHSRQARAQKTQHDESPRPLAKSPPGTVGRDRPVPVLAGLEIVALADDVVSLPLVSRPPFVPPRG